MVKSSLGFKNLLDSEVVSYNGFAQKIGVNTAMKGKEALLLCEKSTHKKNIKMLKELLLWLLQVFLYTACF